MEPFQLDCTPFQRPLLAWYGQNQRVLPWRDNPDAYRVWISEVMLQQTRVETVKPYFERFVATLPSVRALAECPETDLLKLWEGLGYYSRAKNLQKAARVVMESYEGTLPKSLEELRSLPGIGEYTSGAIASIAYGLPVPAVDGNVVRVLTRLAAYSGNTVLPAVRRRMAQAVQEAIPPDRAGDFNQALMELGATVCLPNGEPKCGQCPLNGFCLGKERACDFPQKPPKKARRQEEVTVFLLVKGDKIALRRRPDWGLLSGMWEYPNTEGELEPPAAEEFLRDQGLQPLRLIPLPPAKHIFTHVEWHLHGWMVPCRESELHDLGGFIWEDWETVTQKYPIPTAFSAYSRILEETFRGDSFSLPDFLFCSPDTLEGQTTLAESGE